jgi:N-hydroxyarylamine O-acetyltransferase
MELEAYLKRLGVAEVEGRTLEFLTLLHERHLLEVPFENLDIHYGVEIILDEDRILQKIVANRRGGFCYELNSAFAWLLQKIGYSVTLLSAEVAKKEGGFGIPFDHMILRVDLDRPWLVDVGFGDSFRYPLPLADSVTVEQCGERFQLRRDESWWILERGVVKNGLVPQYRFTLEPRRLSEYQAGCRYHQSSPKSSFTRGPICTKALPEGRVTLHRDRLVTTRGQLRDERPIENRAKWLAALEKNFDIVL